MIAVVQNCLSSRLRLDALVLFGSRARGDALEDSDWDIAVVSTDFAGLNPLQRGVRVLECMRPGVEFVCLTPDELLHPDLSYLRCAVLEEGKALVDRGAFAAAQSGYQARKAEGTIRFRGALVEFGRP